jgi:hypothetical protein
MRYYRCLSFILCLCAAIACHKANTGPGTGSSPLLFVNTSLHSPSVDIYTNGSLLYPGLSFPDSTGYLTTDSRVNRLSLLATGDTLLNVPAVFNPGKQYSIFVIDSGAGGGVELAVIADSLPAVHSGYAMLRFLNFSLSVPSLDLYSASTSQYLFTDRYFDETDAFATSFASFPAGIYNLELRVPGEFISVATLSGVNLQAGRIYTLFAKGSVDVTGSRTLGIGVVQHN